MELTQDETILLSAHKNVWTNGIESERNVLFKKKKEKIIYLIKKSRKVGALFSSRLKSLNFVSLRLNLEVFKAAQSKLSHILTRPIRTSVERMGLGQACDSKRLNDCKR